MDITLIIPAYNEEAFIGACVDAAKAKTRGKLKEIIVVDNASTDKTAEIAESHGARVVHATKKGLTAARQCGFNASSGEYVAYIDADTLISDTWIDVAERELTKHPDAVSLSGPRRHFGTAWYRIWLLNSFWISAPVVNWLVGYMILGGNFIAKRSAIEVIGGFDTTIQFYGEDTDLARRLSKVGKTIFRMDFYVYASARRYDTEGIFWVNIIYGVNYLWPVLFGRPYTQGAQDVR